LGQGFAEIYAGDYPEVIPSLQGWLKWELIPRRIDRKAWSMWELLRKQYAKKNPRPKTFMEIAACSPPLENALAFSHPLLRFLV